MDKLNICSWNANGIKNRLSELIEFLNRFKIDILMVNETKCTSSVKLKIRNFTCVRKNRENSAGGVAMFIKNNVPYKILNLRKDISIECVGIKLASGLHLISTYNNPRNQDFRFR